MKHEFCRAKIQVGNLTHECEMDNGHGGAHVTRVKESEMVYGGFDWTDEQAAAMEKVNDIVGYMCNISWGWGFRTAERELSMPEGDILF